MKIESKPLIDKFFSMHNPANVWKNFRAALFGISFMIAIFLIILIVAGEITNDNLNEFLNNYYQFVLIGIGAVLFIAISSSASKATNERNLIKAYEKIVNEYINIADPILENQNIIYTPYVFQMKKDGQEINETNQYYFWEKDNILCFFHIEPQSINQVPLDVIEIALDDIESFELIGERFYENKISGGGSQKGDIVKAIVGQEMFGTAGAVIGGQQKIDPIKSELILHDDRRTKLYITNTKQNISMMIFDFNMMEILNKIIPAKSKEMIEAITKHKIINDHQSSSKDISDFDKKLELLDKLLSTGVIDNEEYQLRKKKLLDHVLN